MSSTQKEVAAGGVGWRVSVPGGSSAVITEENSWKVLTFGRKVWKMGADDPRKVIHGVKVGLALTLVSLFYYARPLYSGFGSFTMSAVMTVVVVSEYTVGGCLYKAINQTTATVIAGGLAVGIDLVATKSGKKAEPLIRSASVFLVASAAIFSSFVPTVKARFDYGITIFILTFSLVAVSGYRVDELLDLAEQRVASFAIGVVITLLVCLLVCPVWSGQELHLLVSSNLAKLADSLEGCVEDYFVNAAGSSSTKGYENVINSRALEDAHANLARWEPAHSRFGFRHPWKQYLKVGSSTRHCAHCIEFLHACLNSKTKAPESWKRHLRDACIRLNSVSSKVLRELSSCVSAMENRSPSVDLFVKEMKNAVQGLEITLSSLPDQFVEDDAALLSSSFLDIVPLVAMASLLMEVSARVEGVVEAVGTLADMARFASAGVEKSSSSKVQDEEKAFGKN